jgi:enoyl-CoA hydratase/carnithine racemase
MSEAEMVLLDRRGPIATIVLNRPQRRNAFSVAMWQAFTTAVRDLDADESVRVIVVRGAGDQAFASGADIHEFDTQRSNPEQGARYIKIVGAALDAVARATKPVLAMIAGYCVGGGCELACACDLRIAADNARFSIPAARLSVHIGLDEVRHLVGLVGIGRAKDLLLTGRSVDAREAERIGLVEYVVPLSELETFTYELAERLAENAPLTLASTKLAVGLCTPGPEAERWREYVDVFIRTFGSADYREGTRAFLEKRHPRVEGR